MATKARFPIGTTVEYSADPDGATPTWTKIDEVTSAAWPEQTLERSNVSNFDTPAFQQENIVGEETNADLVVEANWTASPAQKALFVHRTNRDMLGWRFTVPNRTATDATGVRTQFKGQLRRCTHNQLTPRDPMKLLLTIICNAPTNEAAPAVT